MTYRLLGIVAFAALLVIVVVLSGGEREGATPPAPERPLPDPGYSALKARLVQTGPDGKPVYTVDAAKVQQRPDEEVVNMEQVQLAFRDSSGNRWTARADHGELTPNSGLIKLDGAVHVAGIVPGTSDVADITTERLAFDTNAQVVATRDPVTLIMSGRHINANGLVANLKDQHVQLESAVHGIYTR